MDTNALSPRPAVSTVTTAPRPTPTPVRVHFSEVLARSLVRGAESVVRALPGGPTMALALRGGSASLPMSLPRPVAGAAGAAPEGPGGVPPGLAGGAAGPGDGGIEQSLAQSQEM